MGDRGNIVVRQGETSIDDIWFYTHWSGYRIGEIVQTSLAKNQRWDDPAYLARIIFTDLVNGDSGETGFGISTSLQDNEYPILVVDIPQQSVWHIEESELENGRIPANYSPKKKVGFAVFATTPKAKA